MMPWAEIVEQREREREIMVKENMEMKKKLDERKRQTPQGILKEWNVVCKRSETRQRETDVE
jgi:hypothetical protein